MLGSFFNEGFCRNTLMSSNIDIITCYIVLIESLSFAYSFFPFKNRLMYISSMKALIVQIDYWF